MSYEPLVLHENGKLIRQVWDRDRRIYIADDVTNEAYQYLFEYCVISEKVTLKDVFLLIRASQDILSKILDLACIELVEECLSPRAIEKVAPTKIEYLELYKHYGLEPDGIEGTAFPAFHGMGPLEPVKKEGCVEMSRVAYGVSFMPTYELAHLPVRLNPTLVIYDGFHSIGNLNPRLEKYSPVQYTLGEILYGITWELSYHGPPAKRDEQWTSLQSLASERKGLVSE